MDAELVKIILWIIGTVVAMIWGWAKARWHLKEGKRKVIVSIVEEAVIKTYDEFVRALKAKGEGKLDTKDIKAARDAAWRRAKKIGKEKGIDFAKEVAKEYFPVLIDKVIKSVKK